MGWLAGRVCAVATGATHNDNCRANESTEWGPSWLPLTHEQTPVIDGYVGNLREFMNCVLERRSPVPDIGDEASLTFTAPPLKTGMARTVLLKASGYYDIHLDSQGAPQAGLLGRFREHPEAAIEYSLQEYLRWSQEMRMRIQGGKTGK